MNEPVGRSGASVPQKRDANHSFCSRRWVEDGDRDHDVVMKGGQNFDLSDENQVIQG
jgi:hypothetical protein